MSHLTKWQDLKPAPGNQFLKESYEPLLRAISGVLSRTVSGQQLQFYLALLGSLRFLASRINNESKNNNPEILRAYREFVSRLGKTSQDDRDYRFLNRLLEFKKNQSSETELPRHWARTLRQGHFEYELTLFEYFKELERVNLKGKTGVRAVDWRA